MTIPISVRNALGANWFFDKSTEFESLLDVVLQQAAASLGSILAIDALSPTAS